MPHDISHTLYEYMESLEIVSTHCHHMEEHFFEDMSLGKLVGQTYASWVEPIKPSPRDEPPEQTWFETVRFNSYFIALQRGLQSIYGIDAPLDRAHWPVYSRAVRDAHQDTGQHLRILRDTCRYRHILQDSYWNPGSAQKDPMFSPVFRINMFLYFHDTLCEDHNGNNALRRLGQKEPFPSLREYICAVDKEIEKMKKSGCVALKNALAYDRDLMFRDETEHDASILYDRLISGAGDDDSLYRLQNYVFFRICEMAAAHALPLQCHTGLGKLVDTRAMCLHDAVAANPQTKFVLFHGSYPYMEDILALCHNMPNVYPDICWLPIISPSAAERFVNDIIEVGRSNSLCWGCDAWTGEESFGALLSAMEVLANTVKHKVENGYFSMSDARDFLAGVLRDNALALYIL